MPWSNNSGGGGWKGGGGPWGSGPQPRGPQPPDLEELLKRSQDRLRSVLPGGGRSNVLIGTLVGIALVAVWTFNSLYMVQPDELAQEMVFGKPKAQVAGQGLHFIFWPVETVEKVLIAVQTASFDDDANRRNGPATNLMLSADQNIVEINFSVQWQVNDPKKFLFADEDPEGFMRRVAESAMRELVGRSSAEQVRTENRLQIESAVRELVQTTLDNYNTGILVVGVNLQDAAPPQEVADAFEEVQRAQQDLERFQREAEQYANRRLGDARGQAAQVTETAEGYRQQVVAEAEGESKRFLSVLKEYSLARDVTRTRLYIETIERVFRDSNKIVLEGQSASSVLPYLPLDQYLKIKPAPAEPAPSTPPTTTGTTGQGAAAQ